LCRQHQETNTTASGKISRFQIFLRVDLHVVISVIVGHPLRQERLADRFHLVDALPG